MINLLKNLFKDSETNTENLSNDLHLLCGLMIEAANIDGSIDQKEIDKISNVLIEVFNEEQSSVEIEIKNV